MHACGSSCCGCAEPTDLGGIRGETIQNTRQGIDVAWRDEHARALGLDHLGNPTDVECDCTAARGHRLEQGERQALVPRRHHQQVDRFELRDQVPLKPSKLDAVLEPQLLGPLPFASSAADPQRRITGLRQLGLPASFLESKLSRQLIELVAVVRQVGEQPIQSVLEELLLV